MSHRRYLWLLKSKPALPSLSQSGSTTTNGAERRASELRAECVRDVDDVKLFEATLDAPR